MKNTIKNIALAVLLVQSSTAFAQNWANAPKVILGIRGGLTFAPTDWEGSDINVFPTAGIATSFRIAKLPFYIETGLYYTNRYIYDYDNHSLLAPASHLRSNRQDDPMTGLPPPLPPPALLPARSARRDKMP